MTELWYLMVTVATQLLSRHPDRGSKHLPQEFVLWAGFWAGAWPVPSWPNGCRWGGDLFASGSRTGSLPAVPSTSRVPLASLEVSDPSPPSAHLPNLQPPLAILRS